LLEVQYGPVKTLLGKWTLKSMVNFDNQEKISNGKKTVSSISGDGKIGQLHIEK